jgi:hypothetical protein
LPPDRRTRHQAHAYPEEHTQMRHGFLRVLTCAVALTAMATSALAGPPVLDGRRTKVLSFSFTTPTAVHDTSWLFGTTPVDEDIAGSCPKPRCYDQPFVYKPFKPGLPFAADVRWTDVTSSFGVHVVDLTTKNIIANCWSYVTPASDHAYVVVPADKLKPGRSYTVRVFVIHSLRGEQVNAKILMPPPSPGTPDPVPPYHGVANGCNR